MAAVWGWRRVVVGAAFIVAGLFIQGQFFGLPVLIGLGVPLLYVGFFAMAVALTLLAILVVRGVWARSALGAAAVGWIVVFVRISSYPMPAELLPVLATLVGVGTFAGAILLFLTKELGKAAGISFLSVAMFSVILVYYMVAIDGINPFAGFALIAVAISSIVTGVVMVVPRRRAKVSLRAVE